MTKIISITGGSASGKTSIANKINDFFEHDVSFLSMDFYYKTDLRLTIEERSKLNYDVPEAFDLNKFYMDVLKLKKNQKIYVNDYDYKNYKSSEHMIEIIPRKILILEGIFTLYDERIRNLSDAKIFVDTDSDERLARRILRDTNENGRKTEDIISHYLTVIKPSYEKYIKPMKKYCDIVIMNGAKNSVAIDILYKYLQKSLEEPN